MAGRHHGRGQQGVEILDLVLAALAVRTVGARNLVGAVVLRAIQCDQQPAVQAAHRLHAAGLLEGGHDIVEHGIEMGWLNRVQFGTHLVISGDFGHAEQGLAVRAALHGLQMPQMRQEGGTLHEERGERGHREVGHGIGRVLPRPCIGQGLRVTAQRGEESVQESHTAVESRIAIQRNRQNEHRRRLIARCDICDPPKRHPKTAKTFKYQPQGYPVADGKLK